MAETWPKLREQNGLAKACPEKIQTHHVKKLLKQLKRLAKEQKLVFVYGKGKRKQPLQRDIETVSEWLRRLKEYQNSLHICGERGSYSKKRQRQVSGPKRPFTAARINETAENSV